MEDRKRKATRWLVVALAMCLISMVGASAVQSGGGSVTIKDVRWETTAGHRMSGLLLIPDGVTAETPAPAVVTSHGMYNNREMQDLNYVELARRGYVVLSMDMFSHGNSESWAASAGDIFIGMYEAVKMMATLPYVDTSRIGITGHSLGGMSSNVAVEQDNAAGEQLIAAVLLNCADATYVDGDGAYANIYGSRDVGIVAAQYDEWFFRQDDGAGGRTLPRDFIDNTNAQSFLHFGADPQGQDARTAYTEYTETIDGEEAIRVIYNPAIIHPWSHFSKRSTESTIAFFDSALGAPNPIDPANQVWQWKAVFNLIGLIGIAIFVVNFTIRMVFTPAFASLRAKAPVEPFQLPKEGKLWFWGSLALSAVFGALTYQPILTLVRGNVTAKDLFRQSSPWGVGMWAAACAVFAILCMVISYRAYGKKAGLNLTERGLRMPLKSAGLTVLLALIVVTVSYGLVFVADFFFKVDFRIWTIALKAFEVDKVWVMLFPSLLLLVLYYVTNSVAVNVFNYNDIGKRKWLNTAIVAAFNAIPPLALLLIQYIPFALGSDIQLNNMYTVWLFPVLIYLPVTAIMSRKVYRATNNPYLPGLVNGILITIISCVNTLTWM